MTTNELEILINSNLSSKTKSQLISSFYQKGEISRFQSGGKTEDPYHQFLSSLPNNLRNEDPEYDMKRFWELNGRPESFQQGIDKGMFSEESDGWHAKSVAYNKDRNVYEWMKSKNHPSAWMENSSTYLSGLQQSELSQPMNDPERPGFLMYLPRHKEGGPVKKLKPTETISIGGKEFDVEIADSESKRIDGLSRVRSMAEDEGMLFIFEKPTTATFTMAETDIDLDICFIDESGTVINVESVEARDPNPVRPVGPFKYVLEVCIDSGIQEGDELDQEDDEDFSEEQKTQLGRSRMLVLNSDGDVQMKLVGGERIVSMIKTRQLLKAALKAYKSDSDSDYRRVGKIIINELDAQDGRDPQYVEK